MNFFRKTHIPMLAVYVTSFLYALHYALPLYIESSFLEQYVLGSHVGLVYSTASVLTIILIIQMPRILRVFGNRRLVVFFIIAEIISLFGLSALDFAPMVVLLFILHQLLLNVIFFNIDLFLESFSKDETTGGTRGIFLTLMNTAIFAGPFLGGLILTNGDFWKIFLWSGLLFTPTIFLMGAVMSTYRDPQYTAIPFVSSLKRAYANTDIRNIFVVYFLLYVFYVWMIIYTPIYLHKEIGFAFSEILGVIMPIALLPFILFQLPLGRLADKKYGEKEFLITGFVIIALSTASMSFLDSTNILVWSAILFMTRIGAAFIEMMSESYFYKQISATDVDLIGAFRNLRPLAYLIAPAGATVLLSFGMDQRYLFVSLALILLIGIYFSFRIHDTK